MKENSASARWKDAVGVAGWTLLPADTGKSPSPSTTYIQGHKKVTLPPPRRDRGGSVAL